jgi:hypothetical protein
MSSAETPPDPNEPEPTPEEVRRTGIFFLSLTALLIVVAFVWLPW